jgi:hypothetical protein
MTPQFKTHEYEFAHGKKPRGRGMWAFVPANYVWGDDMPEDAIAWANGTYTDAKREVAKRYPKIHVWSVLS